MKNQRYVRFNPKKAAEYRCDETRNMDGVTCFRYLKHNVESYPAALFLREWAILYLNEALKSIHK